MEILRQNSDLNIIIPQNLDFKTDLGWSQEAEQMDEEILYQIINPIENYETVRYVNKPYISSSGINQTDIWFFFYFYDGSFYTQDYQVTGLSLTENAKLLKQASKSFFRLEFYKTPNDEPPLHSNRRLVFAKNLSLPMGEKVFYSGITTSLYQLNDFIHMPAFMGSNYRNSENMYFFWFHDDSAFNETTLTGNTFYMAAKFYNEKTGTVTDFVNKEIPVGTQIVEQNDLYYKVIIDRTDFSYQTFRFDGYLGVRVGDIPDPINFYERLQ